MKTFILSDSGRILTLAFGIAFTGSGVGRLLDGAAGLGVSGLAVLLTIALTIVALATATSKHFAAAALAVLIIPWLAFLGEIGFSLMPRSGAIPLVVIGLFLFALAARRSAAPERELAGLPVS